MLTPSLVAADNAAFVGSTGQLAQAMADTLASGSPSAAGKVVVSPGVELRSSTNLTLSTDWNLMPASGQRVGAPVRLTLRATGDLALDFSLSDGFTAAFGGAAGSIAAAGLAQAGPAASYRLVGGADLASADPLAVQREASAGSVSYGRAGARAGEVPPSVFVRSTTGSISVAAALDVLQANSQARLYTTGSPLANPLQALGISFASGQLMRGLTATSTQGPFFADAGAISLQAGRHVQGAPSLTYSAGRAQGHQFVTDWWFRQGSSGSPDNYAVLWPRWDLFAQGVASFGGGDISVRAGQDVLNLDVSTPYAGHVLGAGEQAQSQWLPGGTLQVQAGRDVLGGLYFGGGASATLQAGRHIAGSASHVLGQGYAAPQLFYGNTQWQVQAGGQLLLGSLINPAQMAGVRQGNESGPRDLVLSLAAPEASATLLSAAAQVGLLATRPVLASGDGRGTGLEQRLVPDELAVLAPAGHVALPQLAQRPVGASSWQVLAQGNLVAGAPQVAAAEPAGTLPVAEAGITALEHLSLSAGTWVRSSTGADHSGRQPVHLATRDGNLTLALGLGFTARPLRLVAGKDLAVNAQMVLQHLPQAAEEQTLLQAGRDLSLGPLASLRLGGPGVLLLLAGRDVDMGRGPGVVTVGNADNPRVLDEGGASLHVVAGLATAGGDYAAAVAQEFQLVGSGLQHFAAEVAVALLHQAGHTELADATAFRALGQAQQQALVRQLLGPQQYDAHVAAAVQAALQRVDAQAAAALALAQRTQPSDRWASTLLAPGSAFAAGGAALSDAVVAALRAAQVDLAQVEALRAQVRSRLVDELTRSAMGDALARHVAGAALPAAQRQALLAQVAPYAASLQAYLQRQGVATGGSAQQASQAFAALPLQRQIPFLNEVLFEELRAAGRAAALGDPVAYLRGYQALDALFPGQGRTSAGINLSNSQLKTQQQGGAWLLAPAGGVNVGELSAGSSRGAADLGVITVSGGSINAAVRDNLEVNQSRVFTLARGDVLLWSSLGNLDAGRGAKTVSGAPAPVYTVNKDGQLVVDTSGSFSGSGIAVLDPGSVLDLFAPQGEINAGDAGIRSLGRAFFGATRLVGSDNLNVAGPQVGAPAPPPVAATASLGNLAQAATAAGNTTASTGTEEDNRKKRRPRRSLLLDFLGFGIGPGQ